MTHAILGEGFNGLAHIGKAKQTTVANVEIISLEFDKIPTSGRCMVVHRDELHKLELDHKTKEVVLEKIIDESIKTDERKSNSNCNSKNY